MNLSLNQKKLCEKVVNVFETGSASGNYGAIAIYNDGPQGKKQLTYGRSQTTEYGNLRLLLEKYVAANGMFSKALKPYLAKIGVSPLSDDETFKNLLREAGAKDSVMRLVQDGFFDNSYFKPAMNWASANRFILPLSGLVIYDSFIQSGSVLWEIRQMFSEAIPSRGGNEIEWTTAYVNARHRWLSVHPNPIVRKTIYRTQFFKDEIRRGNWMLGKIPIVANGVKVT
jgi:chitosanase